jgi:site-specific recombinase XerD
MRKYSDCPLILREFLTYHETIKGQSQLTISEYALDIKMFLRFIKLMRQDMSVSADLNDIDIRDVDLEFIREISTSDVFEFLSYLASNRPLNPDSSAPDHGVSAST